MIDQTSQQILCVATSVGKTHDFALFKSSRLALAPTIELLADTGYQGVDKLHPNSQTPHKKSKHHPLTPEQKQQNHALASRRIGVEHVLRILKRFRKTLSHFEQHLPKPQKTLWLETQPPRCHR